jgi:NitT/TauT family transport system ATP-binding protein
VESGDAIPEGDPRGAAGEMLRLREVSKVFRGRPVLDRVTLDVPAGDFVAIVGPSGCGKSTLLRVIAGLTAPSDGSVEWTGGAMAFVFQDPTLFPWRTVRRNTELLLETHRVPKAERRRRAAEALDLVKLGAFADLYPRQLSGGMRMRLSLARSLALDPRLFLFDEPFAAVDEIAREALQDQLESIWLDRRFTAIFVTHNLYEAVRLASRVIVMAPGRFVEDVDVPLPYPRSEDVHTAPEARDLLLRLRGALREAA